MCNDTLPNCTRYFFVCIDVRWRLRKLSDHTLFRLYDVNQRLHSLQTIVIVPDSPSGVRTPPNTREETLVVLTSGVTAINRVSHNEDNGHLESKKSQKENNDQLLRIKRTIDNI